MVTSKVPIEEKIWAREMPLGASHILTPLNSTPDMKPQVESSVILKEQIEEKTWVNEMQLL